MTITMLPGLPQILRPNELSERAAFVQSSRHPRVGIEPARLFHPLTGESRRSPGRAYIPALSDHNVIVRGTGALFLGGPPLVEAATGEDVSVEELGGAEMHTSVSGVCNFPAVSEDDAIAIGRSCIDQSARHVHGVQTRGAQSVQGRGRRRST